MTDDKFIDIKTRKWIAGYWTIYAEGFGRAMEIFNQDMERAQAATNGMMVSVERCHIIDGYLAELFEHDQRLSKITAGQDLNAGDVIKVTKDNVAFKTAAQIIDENIAANEKKKESVIDRTLAPDPAPEAPPEPPGEPKGPTGPPSAPAVQSPPRTVAPPTPPTPNTEHLPRRYTVAEIKAKNIPSFDRENLHWNYCPIHPLENIDHKTEPDHKHPKGKTYQACFICKKFMNPDGSRKVFTADVKRNGGRP